MHDDLQLGLFAMPSAAPAAAPVAVSSSPHVFSPPPPSAAPDAGPARGRSATRARTAVLFSRLQEMGLRGVETLVLMRTRSVMVSHIGRTLRVNEGYAEAPDRVLRAIVAFATARTKTERHAAREVILAHDVERGPARRRAEPARPGDVALLAQLAEAHRQLNAQWFAGTLTEVPVRLSGRMATRLGHFDPGTRHTPPEIVLSRQHLVRHGWREGMHTLLHEMVHQWQHETGRPVDHGADFRAKCREVGITPAARRDVVPIAPRRRSAR
ncbi:MAG: SprT-like domain-containing protein [Gemmatimonadetes bacterium]|nr:SprT-like domain-containing protein [Gemmatimonadota bacterium]